MHRDNTRGNSLRWVIGTVMVALALLVLDHTAVTQHHAGPEEFYAHVSTAIISAIMAGIIGTIAIAKRMRKRLRSLVEKIRLISAGDYTARADVRRIDEIGELGRAFNSMVDHLARSRNLLVEKANTDSVTSLHNHRYFQERLTSEFNRAARYGSTLSLLMIDLDYFKLFNDMNGHPSGDLALKELAAIITKQIRDVDIASRYGGEEFAVILPETASQQAEILAKRIRQAVEDHVFDQTNEQACKLTVSIGVAEYPSHCSDRASLLRAADGALYQAKRKGRNLVETFAEESGSDPQPDPHKLYVLLHATDSTTVEALAAAIDTKHGYPSGHSITVARLACEVGRKLGISEDEQTSIYMASLLRDVGQIAIPDNVLEKTDGLSPEETKLVEKHPTLGYAIVQKSPYMSAMLPAILHHHERFDGTGYPDSLEGAQIPICARIIAVVDAYQSMMATRPYRDKLTAKQAQSELVRLAGSQFDPDIVRAFLDALKEQVEKAA